MQQIGGTPEQTSLSQNFDRRHAKRRIDPGGTTLLKIRTVIDSMSKSEGSHQRCLSVRDGQLTMGTYSNRSSADGSPNTYDRLKRNDYEEIPVHLNDPDLPPEAILEGGINAQNMTITTNDGTVYNLPPALPSGHPSGTDANMLTPISLRAAVPSDGADDASNSLGDQGEGGGYEGVFLNADGDLVDANGKQIDGSHQ